MEIIINKIRLLANTIYRNIITIVIVKVISIYIPQMSLYNNSKGGSATLQTLV